MLIPDCQFSSFGLQFGSDCAIYCDVTLMLIAVSLVLESDATRQSTEIENLTTACCRGKFDTVVGTNIIEPVHKKTNNLGFSTRTDTNQTVQSQNKA